MGEGKAVGGLGALEGADTLLLLPSLRARHAEDFSSQGPDLAHAWQYAWIYMKLCFCFL